VAVFVVQDLNLIKKVILPLFEQNNLLTVKYLDFLSFKDAINIKGNSGKLSVEDFYKIKYIKDNKNFKRINFSSYNKIKFSINPYWLLGFVEAEGTFGIKNLTPYFQIAQHNKSQNLMETLQIYLSNLPNSHNYLLNLAIKPGLYTNNIMSLKITDIDILYYCV
jgi:hypothetical protein